MTLAALNGKRPQDWILMLLAAILFASRWLLHFRGDERADWSAWVAGLLMAYLSFSFPVGIKAMGGMGNTGPWCMACGGTLALEFYIQ